MLDDSRPNLTLHKACVSFFRRWFTMRYVMFFPPRDTFYALAEKGNLIPVYREIMADMDTPVSAFRKLDDGRFSYLLESIEGGEKWGRYSFLGSSPSLIVRSKGNVVETIENDVTTTVTADDPLACIRDLLARFSPVEVEGLPRFFGGAVGYLGYDMVRHFEHLPTDKPALIDAYDSYFLITDTIVIFDNMRQKIKVVSNAHLNAETTPEQAYDEATKKIETIVQRLRSPLPTETKMPADRQIELTSNMTRENYEAAVEKAKEYVRAGDIIQVVPSQRFSGKLSADPFDIYRVMRTLNPSPYMFFLRLDDTIITGASPEVMVRKEGKLVELRPIAGTRPRGATHGGGRTTGRGIAWRSQGTGRTRHAGGPGQK